MLTPFVPAYLTRNATSTDDDSSGCSCTYCLADFGPIDTGENVALTLLAAYTEVGALGGGVICLPPGVLTLGANPTTAVGTNEGPGVTLTEAMSNVMLVGAPGGTILKPASNEIEMFVINGAERLSFYGIRFVNTDNGVLQDQLKPGSKTPGSGVAGLGNAANCAIRQYTGAHINVERCEFWDFHTAVDYIGDYTDTANVYGRVVVNNCLFDGCIFGLLTNRPETVRFTNCEYSNGVNSRNAVGSPNLVDLGSGIYVTDRTSAMPKEVVMDEIHGHNNFGHITKVRKGEVCTATNIGTVGSHRGVQFENIKLITTSNISVKLADINPDDSIPDAVRLVNFGNARMNGFAIDISGCNANAFRINASITDDDDDDDDGFPDTDDLWRNRRATLGGITIIDDGSASHDKPWIVIQGQTDLRLDRPIIHLTGDDFTRTDPMIALEACTRVTLNLPTRDAREALNPVDSDKIVRIDADCDDCTIILDRTCLFVDPTANTVQDSGSPSTTTIRWLDEGAPRIYTANYTVANFNSRLINNKIGADQVVTLPDPALNVGRVLHFSNRRPFNIISASANVAGIADGVLATAIVGNTPGMWATLQSDGTNWIMVATG